MDQSKRVRKLRGKIIEVIPKFPNNRETKAELEGISLATLLIHYLNWVSRYISVKRRKVIIEPTAASDLRWKSLKPQIESLLGEVRAGENLMQHVSTQPQSRGYTPAASRKGPDVDRWADKDFLLNAMRYHHFHLGTEFESKSHVKRTGNVVFAKVSREEFNVLGIFNHSVFDPTGEEMSSERSRLWEIFNAHTCREVPPGSVVISSLIATSGHPVHLVRTAQEYSWVIRELDPKLDDQQFVQGLYEDAGSEAPRAPKLEWVLNFSDLGIHEKNLNHLFVLRRGFN
jgi:hypothetical protein